MFLFAIGIVAQDVIFSIVQLKAHPLNCPMSHKEVRYLTDMWYPSHIEEDVS